MNVNQFKKLIIIPVLKHLAPVIPYSDDAVKQVLGTAVQETQLNWIRQLGDGPARGVYQMEPNTHDDIWLNFLSYKPKIVELVSQLELPSWYEGHDADEMEGNWYYATAMCRLQYYRRPEPLPSGLINQAHYWKKWYNTENGKGTVTEYIHNWRRIVNS